LWSDYSLLCLFLPFPFFRRRVSRLAPSSSRSGLRDLRRIRDPSLFFSFYQCDSAREVIIMDTLRFTPLWLIESFILTCCFRRSKFSPCYPPGMSLDLFFFWRLSLLLAPQWVGSSAVRFLSFRFFSSAHFRPASPTGACTQRLLFPFFSLDELNSEIVRPFSPGVSLPRGVLPLFCLSIPLIDKGLPGSLLSFLVRFSQSPAAVRSSF